MIARYLVGAVAAALMAAAFAAVLSLHGCSGVQVTGTAGGTITTSPGGDWVASVEVGIQITRRVLPAAQAVIDARGDIPAATRAAIDQGFRVGADSLDLAITALQTYEQGRSTASQCQAHFYADQALTAILQALTLATDAGAAIDPQVQAAVGGLGVVLDILFPACAGGGGDAGVHARAAPGAAQRRVQAALGRGRP
jgi:hypothetical protein